MLFLQLAIIKIVIEDKWNGLHGWKRLERESNIKLIYSSTFLEKRCSILLYYEL